MRISDWSSDVCSSDLLQVLAATAERVLDVGVEELVGLGVVADNPFEAARALALEHELGAAQLELAVVAVGADAVEVGQVAVEPVAVGLDQAFDGNLGAADRVDRDAGVGEGGEAGEEKGERKAVCSEFHWSLLQGKCGQTMMVR